MWNETLDHYCIPEQGIDLRFIADTCSSEMNRLCKGEYPDDWLEYVYCYLRADFFPNNFTAEKAEERREAVNHFLCVVNTMFEREKQELPFDCLRDFEYLTAEEKGISTIQEEYERFWHEMKPKIYAFMRLSRICTKYETLGHIAGVHHVAMYMARQLQQTEVPVDLGLMSAAAILHDIGKFGCRKEEGHRVPYLHYYYTYQYCQEHGLYLIGDIASNHSVWDLELENLSMESLLLIYADFRVKSVFNENGKEEIRFWSLDEAYQVILDKLDNVDEKKQQRYARVYGRLKDFEDYLKTIGCSVDLVHGKGPEEEQGYPEIVNQKALVQMIKTQAIHSNLMIMKDITREKSLISLMENIRSQHDSRQIRAYLTAMQDYSDYLPQMQKKKILEFLCNMMAHKEADIRRQAAACAGTLLAKMEICFTKEIPKGFSVPEVGETLENCLKDFLGQLFRKSLHETEEEHRYAGFALQTVLATLIEKAGTEKLAMIVRVFLEECAAAEEKTVRFFLINAAPLIPYQICCEKEKQEMEMFAVSFFRNVEEKEGLVAALRLLLNWLRQGYHCAVDLNQMLSRNLQNMKQEPYCIQFLAARIREFYGIQSDQGIIYYDLTKLYMENQRSEVPWIYKYMNLEILRRRQQKNTDIMELYQYASHLINLLQFSVQIVNRLQAGENLLEIVPLLLETQRYEIITELIKAIENGEYAVSRYIPSYLGRLYHLVEYREKEIILEELEHLLQSQDSRIVIAALETAGMILKTRTAARDVRVKLCGMLCTGLAEDDQTVFQNAAYIIGNDIFSGNTLSMGDKAECMTLMLRKMLSMQREEKDRLFVYYKGAAYHHIYRFIGDYMQQFQEIPVHEANMQTAFFPGTFDPFSLGHKQIVKKLVDMHFRVYLAVDEFSWSKRTQPYYIRKRILAMSVAELPDVYLFPEQIPVNIANKNDLKRLTEALGGRKPHIVVGSDVVLNASAYKKVMEQGSIHTFPHLIFSRNQEETDKTVYERLKGHCRFLKLPSAYETISSTRIRDSVDAGKDISCFVTPGVQNFIYRHGLYAMDSVYKKTAQFQSIQIQKSNDGEWETISLLYEDGEYAAASYKEMGKSAWIQHLSGKADETDDRRLTVLNELLEELQEKGITYAVSRPEKEEIGVYQLHGFIPVKEDLDLYYVDLTSPLVVFYDTASMFVDTIAKEKEVQQAIRKSHIRLLDVLRKIYPGRLILCFENRFMNSRLLQLITSENQVSVLPEKGRKNGEKLCVPFGKILKRVQIPNTVTKELETEKRYAKDMKAFSIVNYNGYTSLKIQIRTIRSFARNVILVDDLLHSGNRIRTIMEYMKKEGVIDSQLIVGVISGSGERLAKREGISVKSVYTVPNLHSWVMESDLYPFLGGNGIEHHEGNPHGLTASINPILPYTGVPFLAQCPGKMKYLLSETCLDNAREIYLAAEEVYRRKNGRHLTLERLPDILLQPRYPDRIGIDAMNLQKHVSDLLLEEKQMLIRLKN